MIRVLHAPRVIHPGVGFVGLELSGPNGRGRFTLVDVEDWIDAELFRWFLSTNGYPSTNVCDPRKRTVTLHQFLLGTRPGLTIDHINRNKLDNRRCNLRFVTPAVNNANTPARRHNRSGIKGVRWHGPSRMWQARITTAGRAVSLGYFTTTQEASAAFQAAHRARYPELS